MVHHTLRSNCRTEETTETDVLLLFYYYYFMLLLIRNCRIIVVTHIKQALLLNIKANSIVILMSWICHGGSLWKMIDHYSIHCVLITSLASSNHQNMSKYNQMFF